MAFSFFRDGKLLGKGTRIQDALSYSVTKISAYAHLVKMTISFTHRFDI